MRHLLFNAAENNITGPIPDFVEKSETIEDLEIFGDCTAFPKIISKVMKKIHKNGKKSLSENQLSTLSLCKSFCSMFVLMLFFSALTLNVFLLFR